MSKWTWSNAKKSYIFQFFNEILTLSYLNEIYSVDQMKYVEFQKIVYFDVHSHLHGLGQLVSGPGPMLKKATFFNEILTLSYLNEIYSVDQMKYVEFNKIVYFDVHSHLHGLGQLVS